MDNLSIEQKLDFIGVRFSIPSYKISNKTWVDIEQTIHEATLAVENDSRLFMVLASWIKVHGNYVVIEKLMKSQKQKEAIWLIALAIFAVQQGLHKWNRLIRKLKGFHALSKVKIVRQAISYKGEEPGFKKYGFLIPKNSIRTRRSDVATVEKLIDENLQYRNRFLYGTNWRSDIITAIQIGYENPYRIMKITGCSYPSAHRVFKEYSLVSEY